MWWGYLMTDQEIQALYDQAKQHSPGLMTVSAKSLFEVVGELRARRDYERGIYAQYALMHLRELSSSF